MDDASPISQAYQTLEDTIVELQNKVAALEQNKVDVGTESAGKPRLVYYWTNQDEFSLESLG